MCCKREFHSKRNRHKGLNTLLIFMQSFSSFTPLIMCTLRNFSHFRVIYPSDGINLYVASNCHLHLNSLFLAFLSFFLSRCHKALSINCTAHPRIPDGILFCDSVNCPVLEGTSVQGMLFIIRCNPKGDVEGQSALRPCPRRLY